MKLRMTHNSIRVRVRKSELVLLQQQQMVEERVQFPFATPFTFALVISKQEQSINAKFEQQKLELSIADKIATQWISTNQVGIETYIPLSDGEQLHLLIEKDFPCIDRTNENKADTFWELAGEQPEVC